MGRESKLKFGPAFHVLLRVLASLKFLRETRLDIFGYPHLRRVERELLRRSFPPTGMMTVRRQARRSTRRPVAGGQASFLPRHCGLTRRD